MFIELLTKEKKGENMNTKNVQLKTYGAQFITNTNDVDQKPRVETEKNNQNIANTLDIIETDINKIKKSTLIDSHERLYFEYNLTVKKLTQVKESYKNKIIKMQEKLNKVREINENILSENNLLKKEYKKLLVTLDNFKISAQNTFCETCSELKDTLEKHSRENYLLKESNQQFSEDILMLKNVIYRVSVQLEKCQQKLWKNEHKFKNDINKNSADFSELSHQQIDKLSTPTVWGSVNKHTLSSLLNAYDETIFEKEDIIRTYEKEFTHFSLRLNNIIDENEELHKRLTIDADCSIKLKEELETIRSDLTNTKQHNELLLKKCSLNQSKLEEILQCYERKLEQSRRDYNIAVDQYHKCKAEAETLKEKNLGFQALQESFNREKDKYISISLHNAGINEYKRLFEELKSQQDQEKRKLTENCEKFQNQLKELQNTIEHMKTDKKNLNKIIIQYRKDIKKYELKFNSLKQSIDEIQMSRNASRNQLYKTMEFAKELVSEQDKLWKTLQQKQQENIVIKQIGIDMANKMDFLKGKLKLVQQEAFHELTSVEQKIKDQNSTIAFIKQEYDEEIRRLKSVMKNEANYVKGDK